MQGLQWEIKRFEELSVPELYQLLRLRSDVFIVEQNCVYPDIDGKDKYAVHLLGRFNEDIVAYARLFKPGDYFDEASIGRVVIADSYRDRKWGYALMQQAIHGITTRFGERTIVISAQEYLQRFYEQQGFVKVSPSYLEDGIPHIRMRRD